MHNILKNGAVFQRHSVGDYASGKVSVLPGASRLR